MTGGAKEITLRLGKRKARQDIQPKCPALREMCVCFREFEMVDLREMQSARRVAEQSYIQSRKAKTATTRLCDIDQ